MSLKDTNKLLNYNEYYLIVKSLMEKFTYLLRIKLIYNALRACACDIQSILEILRQSAISVQKRQIYRDLDAIQQYFIRPDEMLITNFLNNKKRLWRIISTTSNKNINSDQFYSYLLFKHTCPIIFDNIQNEFLSETLHDIFKEFHNQSLSSIVNNQSNFCLETRHFFQKKYNLAAYELFKDLYWCIENCRKISISKIRIDAIGNTIYYVPVLFAPIKFIFHKGAVYIVGISKKKLLVFELMEILSYERKSSSFKKDLLQYRDFIELELNKRFGLAENIDQHVYDIEFTLTDELGMMLSGYNFHPTQQIKKCNKGFKLCFRSGINHELISWIGMWIGDLKIVKPEKLKIEFFKKMEKSKM